MKNVMSFEEHCTCASRHLMRMYQVTQDIAKGLELLQGDGLTHLGRAAVAARLLDLVVEFSKDAMSLEGHHIPAIREEEPRVAAAVQHNYDELKEACVTFNASMEAITRRLATELSATAN